MHQPDQRAMLRTVAYLDQCGYQPGDTDYMVKLIKMMVASDESYADVLVAAAETARLRKMGAAEHSINEALDLFLRACKEKNEHAKP